jgi:hypothetical protein
MKILLLSAIFTLVPFTAFAQQSASSLQVNVRTGQTEIATGGTMEIAVSVHNTGNKDESGLVLDVSFPVQSMSILNTQGGTMVGGHIVWTNGALKAGETKTMVLQGKLNKNISQGQVVRISATVRDSNNQNGAGSSVDLRVVGLPRTGISDYLLPIENSQFQLQRSTSDSMQNSTLLALLMIGGFTIGSTQVLKVFKK